MNLSDQFGMGLIIKRRIDKIHLKDKLKMDLVTFIKDVTKSIFLYKTNQIVL